MPRAKKQEEIPALRRVVYSQNGLGLCPTCFSRPSISKRLDLADRPHSRGWEVEVTDTPYRNADGDGQTYKIATLAYPCSNDHCRTEIVVQFLTGVVGYAAVAPFAAVSLLSNEEEDRYRTGRHRHDGVWLDVAGKHGAPEKKEETVVKSRKPPVRKAAKKRAESKKPPARTPAKRGKNAGARKKQS